MKFIKISIRNACAYKWSVIFAAVSSVLSIWVLIYLWKYLYRNDELMISYMVSYTVLANIVSIFYCRGISNRIGDRVKTGTISIDLIKPINFFVMSWQIELGEVFTNFIFKGLPIILVYCKAVFFSTPLYNIAYVVIAVVLGHIIFVLLYSLLGFLAIVLFDIWPFQRLLDDTIRLLGGGFLPLSILPNSLYKICTFLPFHYLYSFPVRLMLEKMDYLEISKGFLVELLWIIVLGLVDIIAYRVLMRKVVIQGG